MESLHTDCLSKKSSEERIVSVMHPNKVELSDPESYYLGSDLSDQVKFYLDKEAKDAKNRRSSS